MSFARKDHLAAHGRNHHQNDKNRKKCVYCSEMLHPNSLKRHQKSLKCRKYFETDDDGFELPPDDPNANNILYEDVLMVDANFENEYVIEEEYLLE